MIGELCEVWDWIKAATSGWRFIFSPTFRAKTIRGWKSERWYYVVWDVTCGLAGIAASLLPIFAVFYLMSELLQK